MKSGPATRTITLFFCLFGTILREVPAEDTGSAPPPPLFHRPHLLLGGGVLSYTEHEFDTSPGLQSSFDEPFAEATLGWDLIFQGHQGLSLDLEFSMTPPGTERWMENGTLVQLNDLQVGRLGAGIGYSYSFWNRASPPENLPDPERTYRFTCGIRAFYRLQAFWRDDFLLLDRNPPEASDILVRETFDMFGAEIVLDFEVGPRHIAAAFLRGRGGAAFVTVLNNGLSYNVDPEDARINTFGVHGTGEIGMVSRILPPVELRIGYRYHRLEVFGSTTRAPGFDSLGSPIQVTIELPDNTTEIHMGFIEASIPF